MAYVKSNSQSYGRSEKTSSSVYSRSSKTATSMSSNQNMLRSGYAAESIESNQQDRSFDFDESRFNNNYLAAEQNKDFNNNNPITIRSLKSPAPNRKSMQSPVKDGFRKVTVSSGSNKIDHFSKSATFSDDEDDSVFVDDDENIRYIDEAQIVATDASQYDVSGKRSFEDMYGEEQQEEEEEQSSPYIMKGQPVNFQFNMANPDEYGSGQYYKQNKDIHTKRKTPEIQVEQYNTPPSQRSKKQYKPVNMVISTQEDQDFQQQRFSGKQRRNQQKQNQQVYEPVNVIIPNHSQHSQDARKISVDENSYPRYQPVQVEIKHHKKSGNNSYSPRNLPDYQQKRQVRNIQLKAGSDSEYSNSHFEPQTPVDVIYSPMPQRKPLHAKNLPIDITIARDGDHLQKPNAFRVLVSPTPQQNEVGFVPVHRHENHHFYGVQQEDVTSQPRKGSGKIKPKPRRSSEQNMSAVDAYNSFQGIDKDLYRQQHEKTEMIKVKNIVAEPVHVQEIYDLDVRNEDYDVYQDQQNQISATHVSVRHNSESNRNRRKNANEQKVDQERRRSFEHQRMESARLKKIEQEEMEVKRRQQEAYQRQQKIEMRKREEEQRRKREQMEQARREEEAEYRRKEAVERKRREEQEMRQREEFERKKREEEEKFRREEEERRWREVQAEKRRWEEQKRKEAEEIRRREEIEKRKREEGEIRKREEEIRRRRIEEEQRRKAEQQKMEEVRLREEQKRHKEENLFQQQQFKKSIQRSQSQKYYNENQINDYQQDTSTFPRHLKIKKQYQSESLSANNTPNVSQQRKFHKGYSMSASNTPEVSRKQKNSSSCYTCEHENDEHDGMHKRTSSHNTNTILGRTEMGEKRMVSQLIRPKSVDITRQSKTLPRGFGRAKSQEWITGYEQNNQTRSQNYSTSTTTRSISANQTSTQQAHSNSRRIVQRPKSAHEFDSKKSKQRHASKVDYQYSQQQPFLEYARETYPIQEQQLKETFLPVTHQQPQKSHVVEYHNGSDVKIISSSHVVRDAKYNQANQSRKSRKNREVVQSKAYTNLSRKDQRNMEQRKQANKQRVETKTALPDEKDIYQSIKVTAKGGVITLCMEEGEDDKITDTAKNRLTKSVYEHEYNNSYYTQSRDSQYGYQSNSSQRQRMRSNEQENHSYQNEEYISSTNNNNRIQSKNNFSAKNNSSKETESVYYTVCTRYFQPENYDWITNIHRMGKTKVPVGVDHSQRCVFWSHLYDPDREEITVQKLVPPPDLLAKYHATSNNEGIYYGDNIMESRGQEFEDSSYSRSKRSHDKNRRHNRSYNDASFDSDGESKASSILSNRSDTSFKHSKPKLLRKSKEFPGARNEMDTDYQQSYSMQQTVY